MKSGWTPQQDQRLVELVREYGQDWHTIFSKISGRTIQEIESRWNHCLNPDLIKGSFLEDEDDRIIEFVRQHGEGNWRGITQLIPNRTPKQCRERWIHHLSPGVRKEPWTDVEDALIFDLYLSFGGQWSTIARALPGRTDNSVKNRFNSSLSKRMEFDETGKMVLLPSKARTYVRKIEKRKPAWYALDRQTLSLRRTSTSETKKSSAFADSEALLPRGNGRENFLQHWDLFPRNPNQ
jgi:hypothetical protein